MFVRYDRFMDEPKDRLKLARSKLYPTPTAAADAVKEINKNTLISNENGNRAISRKMAEVYAKHFDVSAGWILYGEMDVPDMANLSVPIVSWVSAGALQETASVDDFEHVKYIDGYGLDPSGDWIALRVEGRSMDKVSPQDSIIFVNRNEKTLIPNGLYIIGDGNGGATYKRYRPPNILEPVTTKPEMYERIEIEPGQQPDVIGRVRRTVLDL